MGDGTTAGWFDNQSPVIAFSAAAAMSAGIGLVLSGVLIKLFKR